MLKYLEMERFGKQSEKYKEAQGLSKEALSRILSHEGKIYAYAADDALAGLLGAGSDRKVMLYNRIANVARHEIRSIIMPAFRGRTPQPRKQDEAKFLASLGTSFPELQIEKAEEPGECSFPDCWYFLRRNPRAWDKTVVFFGLFFEMQHDSWVWKLAARTFKPEYVVVEEWVSLKALKRKRRVSVNTKIYIDKADGTTIDVGIWEVNGMEPTLDIYKSDKQHKGLFHAGSESRGYFGTLPAFIIGKNGETPRNKQEASEWLGEIREEVKSGLDMLRDNAYF